MLIPRNLASRFEGVSVSAYYNKGLTYNNNNCPNYKNEYFQEQKIGRHDLGPDSSLFKAGLCWTGEGLYKVLKMLVWGCEEKWYCQTVLVVGSWNVTGPVRPAPAHWTAAYNAGESREWKTELAEHLMTLISLQRVFSGYWVDPAANRYQCIERVWGLEEEMWRKGELFQRLIFRNS